jgi:glycosyltransferase involved in cell wall biosynthesis
MKIGVGITTYNSEKYFEALYNSLPLSKITELVVVNDGEPYSNKYDCNWIQHHRNNGPSVSRNDCLLFLQDRDIDYFFLIEDDMIIKDPNIFEKYIEASNESKLEYLCFVSTSWESGTPGNRAPKLEVQYNNNVSICFYPHMCNEFTFKTRQCLQDTGLYDKRFKYMFDVENVYNITKARHCPGFWWFPDIKNSDELIQNNPETQSRVNNNGERDKNIAPDFKRFYEKHKVNVNEITCLSQNQIIDKLKSLKNK